MTAVEPPLLQVAGLHKRFGETAALQGVELNVKRGEVVCIIGPSGCGKSTLLRCINWLEAPDHGEVMLAGEVVGMQAREGAELTGKQHRALNVVRARMGMVFQQFNLWPHLSVLENVVRAQVVVLKRSREEAVARATHLIERVGLSEKLDAMPTQLSGGQQQRVAIARALAMDPLLMLFDEPTSALDPELVGEVLNVLRGLADAGMTMLIVTHELGFARRVADTLVFMDAGRIVERDTPGALLRNPSTERMAAFLEKLDFAGTQLEQLPDSASVSQARGDASEAGAIR